MHISVIIPTHNESMNIVRAVGRILGTPDTEIIVVDGASTDNTVELAGLCGVRVLCTPPGRARQMNAGADAATGDVLLFLHADTVLPEKFCEHIRRALSPSSLPLSHDGARVKRVGVVAGAFELSVDSPKPGLRIIERLANWRSRALGMPYGDQAIFVRADVFRKAGGFAEMPIMEDYELMRRLRRLGRIEIAGAPVLTSARRWERLGVLRTTLINQAMILGYYAGVSPRTMSRWYG